MSIVVLLLCTLQESPFKNTNPIYHISVRQSTINGNKNIAFKERCLLLHAGPTPLIHKKDGGSFTQVAGILYYNSAHVDTLVYVCMVRGIPYGDHVSMFRP